MKPFRVPSIYKYFPDEIKSINLESLFNSKDPLNYLRKLYINDIGHFYTVRNELLLRGITLFSDYENNYFPPIKLIDETTLVVDTDQEFYKKLDFSLLNLPGFIEKYNVRSDLFFNAIPLEGFTFLTKNYSVPYIKNFFIEAGYKVSTETYQTSFSKKIEEVFDKQNFASFRRFCRHFKIANIQDLNPQVFEEYKKMPGVGSKAVSNVIENYETFINTTKNDTSINMSPQSSDVFEDSLDYVKLLKFSELHLKHGYAFSNDIFLDMQFDEDIHEIIHNYKIDSHKKLTSLLIKSVDGLEDNSGFLYLRTSPFKSIENFLSVEFPKRVSRKNLKNFLELKGYSAYKSQEIIRKLVISKTFLEYDSENFVNRSYININQSLLSDLNTYLKNQFNNNEFLVISSLVGFRLHLPPTNIGVWTPHLIFHVSQEIGYKPISTLSNYKHEKLIIVTATSKINNFFELVYHILNKQYAGPMHIDNIKEFLVHQSVCNSGIDLKKTLSYSSLFKIDQLNWVTLKNNK